MNPLRVLISGGGIAGLTLAYWLRHHGHEPVIVEAAPAMRGGGYMIDFWGLGFDVAERMRLIDRLKHEHIEIPNIEFVDAADRVGGRFRVRKLREVVGWRHFNLLRSGLERVLYEQIVGAVPVRFATRIASFSQAPGSVEVTFEGSPGVERYDLLVGADGLRSSTRRQLLGGDERFERYLGYCTASFTVEDFLGLGDVFRLFSVPGKQVGVYSIGGGRLATFFVYRQVEAPGRLSTEQAQAALAEAFAGLGWKTGALLERMGSAPDFYFDAVSQVVLEDWSKGRVALVGDACQCVSLISGQGSALAMAGAYLLAGELGRSPGDVIGALQRYREAMLPEVRRKQQMATRFASSFIPGSKLGIFVRDTFANLMFLPVLSRIFIRQFLSDALHLPDYGSIATRPTPASVSR